MTISLAITPLFALVDLGFGANLRAPAFEVLELSTPWRVAFYLAVTAVGALAIWVPAAAAALGAAEAGLNVMVTCLAVFVPYVQTLDAARAGEALEPIPFPMAAVIITALTASISVAALKRDRLRAHGDADLGGLLSGYSPD